MARILLVDDDAFLRKMLSQMLTTHGNAVVEAGNGVEGLEKMLGNIPELIITDIIMAGKEGLHFIRDIRDQGHRMPIIAMSAGGLYGNTNYLQMAESLGATVSLQKPLNADQLLATVDRLLKSKS